MLNLLFDYVHAKSCIRKDAALIELRQEERLRTARRIKEIINCQSGSSLTNITHVTIALVLWDICVHSPDPGLERLASL